MKNLIDEYVELIQQVTDAPPLFVKASAYFTLSFLLGYYVRIVGLQRPEGNRVNEWFILSGLPAITRKSTIIEDLTQNFCVSAYTNFLMERYNLDSKEANKLARLTIIEDGTPEGILDRIQSCLDVEGVDRFALINSEFGTVLLEVQNKQYMSNYMKILSKLYDCAGYLQFLSKKTKKSEEETVRYIPRDTYVCALLGMQDPHLFINPRYIQQGTMRRLILVHQEPSDKRQHKPLIDLLRQVYLSMFMDLANEFSERMVNFAEAQVITTEFKKEVIDEINDYSQQIEKQLIDKPNNLVNIYKQSMGFHLLKLTVLESIARHEKPNFLRGGYVIDVTEQDLKRAKEFIDLVLDKAERIIGLISAQPRIMEVPLATSGLDYIYSLIRSAGKVGISKEDLLLKSGMLINSLKPIVITLLKQGMVVSYKFGNALKFYPKEYEKFAVAQGGNKVSPEVVEMLL